MFEDSEEKDINENEAESVESTNVEADTSIVNTANSEELETETSQNVTENEITESPATTTTSESVSNVSEPQIATTEPVFDAKQLKVRSRELKSLLEAAKESNLDTNIVHKRESRKSETFGVAPTTSTKRRNSTSSNDSYQSNEKRNMRSQNPEFVQKHRKFLKTVTGLHMEDDSEESTSEDEDEKDDDMWNKSDKEKISREGRSKTPSRPKTPTNRPRTPTNGPKTPKTPKRKRESFGDNVGGASVDDKKTKKLASLEGIVMKKDKDKFCWRCHREAINIQCETCPRSYHLKCLKTNVPNPEHWPCPECLAIIRAESTKTRPQALKGMTQEHLCELLKFAVKRMITCPGSEPFIHPVDIKTFPDYRTFIIQPMDLTTLQNNIRDNLYGSTVAFTADAKWILHNSIIFNSHQSKLTTAAKAIVKICKQEMSEIETCAECYLNANTRKNTWFVEVCSKPHVLLWAKLKGFPYWPAKGMKIDGNNVDVKFFGAHDRAWVPVKECFLYSRKDPNTTNKQKRSNIAECVKEVDVHIENLKNKFGEFRHAPYRTLYNPTEENLQLSLMLPRYKPNLTGTPRIIPKIETETKPLKKRIKSSEESDSDDDFSPIRVINNDQKPQIKRSRNSRSTSKDGEETNNTTPTSSSQSSLLSEENPKSSIKCSITEFDKFVEGYGTEDEELVNDLDIEARNKIVSYDSDSDDESAPSSESPGGNKSVEEDDMNKSSVSSSDTSTVRGRKCRTRGGYLNVSGKIKVISSRKSEEFENGRKRSSEDSPETSAKISRLSSRDSNKTDSEKLDTDKINKVEELPESCEISFGNVFDDVAPINFNEKSGDKVRPEFVSSLEKTDLEKIKPITHMDLGELYNSNKDFRISPPIKTESITDKLMKRMSISQSENELERAENVKKQIFDSLEATSSTLFSELEKESEDEVVKTSSDTKDGEGKEVINNKNKDTIESDKKANGLNEEKRNENKTEKAAADSSFSPDDKSSDEDSDTHYLHLTAVKKSYRPASKAVIKLNDDKNNDLVSKNSNLNKTNDKTSRQGKSCEAGAKKEEENKAERKINEKVEGKTNEKIEKKINKKSEEKPDEKDEMKIREKTNEKVEEKTIEKVEGKTNEQLEEKTDEKCIEKRAVGKTSNIAKPTIQDVVSEVEKKIAKTITIRKVSKENNEVQKSPVSNKQTEEEDTTTSSGTSDDEETQQMGKKKNVNPMQQQLQKQLLRIVNVGDIISGKIDSHIPENITLRRLEKKKEEPKSTEKNNILELEHDIVEIKSEPVSDSEDSDSAEKSTPDKTYDVTLSVVNKEKKKIETINTSKSDFKVVDNLTRIIDSVAKNKFGNEISLRPISNLQNTKQKARKTFPSVTKTIQIKKVTIEKKDGNDVTQKPVPPLHINQPTTQSSQSLTPSTSAATPSVSSVPQVNLVQTTPSTTVNKESLVFITQQHSSPVVLPPNQPISLAATGGGSPMLAVVQHPTLTNTGFVINTSQPIAIPVSQPATCTVTPSISAITSPLPNSTQHANPNPTSINVLPNDISALVGEVMTVKAPPRLKPKPPGPLSTYFDEGLPSSAGPVTKTINSVAHRLADYFRGLLSETLSDLNVAGSPEAKIRALELEVEALKFKHQEEVQEFKKNISTVLKDIQKSFAEEKHKIIDETRATCEAERLRSVEEAKSKQWCAYCLKEAQFYCCWNTSYCDYPCQQKHWTTHMKTCTQSTVRTNQQPPQNASSTNVTPSADRTKPQQTTVFKQVPKQYASKVLKSTRMLVKPGNIPGQKTTATSNYWTKLQSTSSGSSITLLEQTPGNFEVLGNPGPISIDGKVIPSATFIGKIKTSAATNSTTTTNSSTPKTIFLSQKAVNLAKQPTSTTNSENTSQ